MRSVWQKLAVALFPLIFGRFDARADSFVMATTTTSSELHSKPDKTSHVVLTVPSGARLVVEDNVNGWLKVIAPNGEAAWLASSSAKVEVRATGTVSAAPDTLDEEMDRLKRRDSFSRNSSGMYVGHDAIADVEDRLKNLEKRVLDLEKSSNSK